MRDFTKSWHCVCGLHCDACRNNAAWRAGKAKKYAMPEKCPHGGPGRRMLVPDEAQAICEACDGRGCPNNTFCCGGKRTLAIQYPCPRGNWTMIPDNETGGQHD